MLNNPEYPDYPLPLQPTGAPLPQFPPTREGGFESELRAELSRAKRIVVKIGSSSLTKEDFTTSTAKIDRIVDAICARMNVSDVILVSSGAVAAGMRPMGLTTRPKDLATKQAAASVGQVHLA